MHAAEIGRGGVLLGSRPWYKPCKVIFNLQLENLDCNNPTGRTATVY